MTLPQSPRVGADSGGAVAVRAETSDAGERIDRLLARRLGSLSRSRVKRLIEEGQVSLDGALFRDPSLKVRPGQDFVVTFPEMAAAAPAPQKIALDIRFEDAHIIVIDKPAGIVVHPGPGNPEGTLVNALIEHCGNSLSGIGGVLRPGIVHRLDKLTSGLLVVAKSEIAHQRLSRDFALRRIERAYRAFVWGVPVPAVGEIVGNIGRSAANRKKMAVVREGKGRTAITGYRVLRSFRDAASELECRLGTGRTHQVRVHLAHRGHPLIGDPLYGTRAGRAQKRQSAVAKVLSGFARQALHANRLGFEHPVCGTRLAFESGLPVDLRYLADCLEQF
jgi:23S rRNA pseudouridine1911/1915/1917 synthase